MSELVTAITHCRACGSGQLDVVLDLGTHAVSDFYDAIPDDELRAPLCLVQCEPCGLVQLTHSVSRDRLYKDYWYRSGLNPSMVESLKDVVDDALRHRPNPYIVLDIGSNDNSLLDQYPVGIRTVGVEPSNLCPELKNGDRHIVYHDFYPAHYPIHTVFRFDIITTVAMWYDQDDPNTFLNWLCADLNDGGIWVNQMMDLEGMLAANAVDNCCAEHVAYWDFQSFHDIVTNHGLYVSGISRNATNGGSTRTVMRHGKILEDTLSAGAARASHFNALRAFAQRLPLLKEQCLGFLDAAKANGETVCGYGASTKGNTLLQYYGITTDLLPMIADRNPDKWGKITAGSHIPIISESEMRERKPDYLLVFPWAFLDHFIDREKDLLAQGTRLVVPLPTFRVVQ